MINVTAEYEEFRYMNPIVFDGRVIAGEKRILSKRRKRPRSSKNKNSLGQNIIEGVEIMNAVLPFDPITASLYGQFIQTAYSMQSNAPQNQTPPLTSDFPPGYKMVAWVQMKDFIIESTGPVFYGIVAQSILHPEQYVVAIRGTSDWVEWWDDVNALGKIPFKIPNCGDVAAGIRPHL